jgi:hypothetical protein
MKDLLDPEERRARKGMWIVIAAVCLVLAVLAVLYGWDQRAQPPLEVPANTKLLLLPADHRSTPGFSAA